MNSPQKLRIFVRHARNEDVSGMLKIEKSRYSELYKNKTSLSAVEKRFKKRIEIAKSWMWVAQLDSQIVGFITGQPTNSKPEDFESWEKSTDNGTLKTTFEPDGENVYVVNLDVDRKATKLNAQYMLMAQLGAKCIREAKAMVIFESRMPEFRRYVYEELGFTSDAWELLDYHEKMNLAIEYSKLTTERNGKIVPKDRLLRFYKTGGFHLVKVFPNAFKDPESLDFGVLCTGNNPIPKSLRFGPINFLVSKIFEKVANNPKLLNKLVR